MAVRSRPAGHPSGAQILIVEDDAQVRSLFLESLRLDGYQAEEAADGEEALRRLESGSYDLVLADVRMPRIDGEKLLRIVKERHPETPVILVTGFGDVEQAVRLMKEGAHDYLLKPVSASRLRAVVARTLGVAGPRSRLNLPVPLRGESRAIHGVVRQVREAARGCENVLLIGEPGTGRAEAAQAIHELGPRRAGPFVRLRPSPRSADELQAALFHPVHGAFASAANGTLLLEGVDSLPAASQDSLSVALPKLQGVRPRKVRLLSAGGPELERAVRGGTFSPKLFVELGAVTIHLPPLRERPEDIEILGECLLREECAIRGRQPVGLSPRSIERLLEYSWPGNLDELRSAMMQAAASASRRVVRPVDLGPWEHAEAHQHAAALPDLSSEERRHIREVMARTHGNKRKAAKILGISRGTLYRKLGRYGVEWTKKGGS